MRTSKNMTKAIQNKVITDEILGMCVYSCNKRAKNCRDKEREYRSTFDYHGYGEKYRNVKKMYYSKKEKFLSVVAPVCVHITKESKDVYHGRDYVWTDKVSRYYIYYKIGDYGFHSPIDVDKIPADLPIEDIGEFATYGKDPKDLLSVQFCDKVLALIESGDYQYIPQWPLKEAQSVDERNLCVSL